MIVRSLTASDYTLVTFEKTLMILKLEACKETNGKKVLVHVIRERNGETFKNARAYCGRSARIDGGLCEILGYLSLKESSSNHFAFCNPILPRSGHN